MPVAKCILCGEEVHWRNKRGTRLCDIKCPKCNGDLKRAAWSNENGYQVMKSRKNKKGKMIVCPLCRRKRKDTGGNVRILKKNTTFKIIKIKGPLRFLDPNADETEEVKLKAGETICWFHKPDYPIRLYQKND